MQCTGSISSIVWVNKFEQPARHPLNKTLPLAFLTEGIIVTNEHPSFLNKWGRGMGGALLPELRHVERHPPLRIARGKGGGRGGTRGGVEGEGGRGGGVGQTDQGGGWTVGPGRGSDTFLVVPGSGTLSNSRVGFGWASGREGGGKDAWGLQQKERRIYPRTLCTVWPIFMERE